MDVIFPSRIIFFPLVIVSGEVIFTEYKFVVEVGVMIKWLKAEQPGVFGLSGMRECRGR